MDTNRQHNPTPSRRPLHFKLPSFAPDEKLAFVDSVCRILMKSRCGDGAMYTRNPRFRGTPDEPFDYLDVLKDQEQSVGWHDAATFPGGTIPRRVSPDRNPARSNGIDATTHGQHLAALSPATLGRGSP